MAPKNRNNADIALSIALRGAPPDAALQFVFRVEHSCTTFAQLLDAVFPEDESAQGAVEQTLDVQENPDLPDIYDLLLPIIEQHRRGLCRLNLAVGGDRPAELFDAIEEYLEPPSNFHQGMPGYFGLDLVLVPDYRALEYAEEQGYGEGPEELLGWLRSCTLLYFLDKHEYRLLPPEEGDCPIEGDTLNLIVEDLRFRQFLGHSGDFGSVATNSDELGPLEITPTGRRYIGALLSETEACIDRFDVFKDVLWDPDTDSAEFDTGYGDDLRVQVFIAEGLDPVRTVFLLRLYDGTLDEFKLTWPELIGDPDFFDQILEPVLDRCQAPEELLQAIIEDGYAYAEERAESEREERSQAEIARRLRAL